MNDEIIKKVTNSSYKVKRPWLRSCRGICVVCNKEFISKRHNSLYCSQTCCNKASWERMKNNPERLNKHNLYNNEYRKKV